MHDHHAAVAIVERLKTARVLCVGDIMLDRFVYGSVNRISPEAPIPVIRVEDESAMLGGAGNVVRNLVSLGAEAVFVSAVGTDPAGDEVGRLLSEHPGVRATLIPIPGRPTTIKTRFVAANQQMLRADRETTETLAGPDQNKLLDSAKAAIETCGIVVLSDYGKGVLDGGVAADLIQAAREAGRPVTVDPKGIDYGRYRGATLITPNRKELHEAARLPVGTEAEIETAARALIDEYDLGAVLATLGPDGMMLVSGDGKVVVLDAEAREVFDVSGAGDTVVATLSAAIAAGADIENAAALANVAAGVVVGKVGTASAHAADVIAALHRRGISDAEAKVLTLDQAKDRVEAWRRQEHKVGFTNGCFDLLHPGHVSLLSQARASCDRLVVGLNSDDSVKRLGKGEERPIQTETARATVLAGLANVDAVVIFGEDTPLTLIETLRPDLLVKGADYAPEDVVGTDVVRGYGGKVLLAELKAGHSTTLTIRKMNGE